jgi:hypothetical protein
VLTGPDEGLRQLNHPKCHRHSLQSGYLMNGGGNSSFEGVEIDVLKI